MILELLVAGGGLAGFVALLTRARSGQRQITDQPQPRRPVPGSPARPLLSRGTRIVRELGRLLAGHEAWHGVVADANQVLAELRMMAGQVAELEHALAQLRGPEPPAAAALRELGAAHLARMEVAVAGLERARAEVLVLIARSAAPPLAHDPTDALNSRLAGLRAGLAEIGERSNPETGSGFGSQRQGHP
ncbi:hypothetical protein [Actinophytocola sp.]|uniref:hypothetical protein n=1 Tax=Actinophytocola sp. TaxID=1872138 RepID=UPI002D7E5FCB|nr:hypothetical protein [Actinophytocola sp.]HET9140657.1 hypothetical protein [Actinophytocola sp.]